MTLRTSTYVLGVNLVADKVVAVTAFGGVNFIVASEHRLQTAFSYPVGYLSGSREEAIYMSRKSRARENAQNFDAFFGGMSTVRFVGPKPTAPAFQTPTPPVGTGMNMPPTEVFPPQPVPNIPAIPVAGPPPGVQVPPQVPQIPFPAPVEPLVPVEPEPDPDLEQWVYVEVQNEVPVEPAVQGEAQDVFVRDAEPVFGDEVGPEGGGPEESGLEGDAPAGVDSAEVDLVTAADVYSPEEVVEEPVDDLAEDVVLVQSSDVDGEPHHVEEVMEEPVQEGQAEVGTELSDEQLEDADQDSKIEEPAEGEPELGQDESLENGPTEAEPNAESEENPPEELVPAAPEEGGADVNADFGEDAYVEVETQPVLPVGQVDDSSGSEEDGEISEEMEKSPEGDEVPSDPEQNEGSEEGPVQDEPIASEAAPSQPESESESSEDAPEQVPEESEPDPRDQSADDEGQEKDIAPADAESEPAAEAVPVPSSPLPVIADELEVEGSEPSADSPVGCAIILDDGTRVEVIEIITVGRNPSAEAGKVMILNDKTKTMSKNHARLVPTPAGIRIVDLKSTNGTHISGRGGKFRAIPPGKPILAETGSTVRVGGRFFTVTY